jgi:hypothetical protein
LLNELERLATDTGAAVAFGAHFSKGNQAGKASIDRISGSGVYARDPDSIVILTQHEDEGALTVEATLRNFPPMAPFVVKWGFPLMRRDNALNPAKLKAIGGRPKKWTTKVILDVLKGHTFTTKEWQKLASSETGIPKTQFYELFKSAKGLQGLKQTPDNQWVYDDTANLNSES